MAKKRNHRVPVHSMADEPAVRYEDIAVDISAAEAAAELEAEVAREYTTDMSESDFTRAEANFGYTVGEDVSPAIARVQSRGDYIGPEEAKALLAGRIPDPDEVDDLSGTSQDEIVDGIEEIKEMAEQVARAAPKACPTCKRPFVVATVNAKTGEETKSSKIRRMAAEGIAKGMIARDLGISYQFVHNVLSRPVKSA